MRSESIDNVFSSLETAKRRFDASANVSDSRQISTTYDS